MNYCLATVANKKFLIGLEIMLYSFIKNNPWFNKDIIVISNDLEEKDLERIKLIYNNIKIHRYDAEKYNDINTNIEKIKGKKEIYGTYSKYELFSIKYNRVVFLDSDILINDSIKELFEEQFEGNIAMVHELEINQYNTGVIVIKEPFLNKQITDELIRNTKLTGPTTHTDQDIINTYFNKKITSLNVYYNFLKHYIRQKCSWINRVKILHYVSKKPWITDTRYTKYSMVERECLIVEDYWFNYKNEFEKKVKEIENTVKK